MKNGGAGDSTTISWQDKQEQLKHFLAEHQAEEAPYRVDLGEGKIFWVNEMGLSLAVADCKVLLSYALSNRSILMAWANASLAPDTGIEALDGFESIYHDCDPEHVWQLAMAAADEVGAEALYRAPSPQSWVMLGLWNLRGGGAEQFYSGSPRQFVSRVLDQLGAHQEIEELPVLLSNYSQSLLQLADHPHKGSQFEEPLRKTAKGMLSLRDLAFGQELQALRARLTELGREWENL